MPERLPSAGGGMRTRVRIAAEISQVAASTASAEPGPTVTTRVAATDGPSTASEPRAMDISTFACCSCARGTSWGSAADIAGNVATERVPLTAARTMKCQCATSPVITSRASTPWARPAPVLPIRITRALPTRSAITATDREEHHQRMLWPASTWPSAAPSRSRPGRRTRARRSPSWCRHVDHPGRGVASEVGLAQRREQALAVHPPIRNATTERFTASDPSARGGRASSWTRADASRTRASAFSHTSGLTHSSASVNSSLPWRCP